MTKSIVVILFMLTSVTGFSQVPPGLKITPLKGDFYIYTTYQTYQGQSVSANGMYLITEQGAVLFDSPWDPSQFQPLLDSIKVKHKTNVTLCIATHSHGDRTGGLKFYREKNIKTYTTRQTDEICKKTGQPRAEFLIEHDTVFHVGQYSFQTFYPGPGHSPDNIVIWFGKERILYGGCMIKSVADKDLGNLADANTKVWPESLKKIQAKCPNPEYVIPGHDVWSSNKSIEHTLEMLKTFNREK